MKLFKKLYIPLLLTLLGCNDGYIDEISSVDPGPDQTAPTVAISFPLEGTLIRVLEEVAPITIKFEASDDIEIESVTLDLDGTQIASFSDFLDYRKYTDEFLYDNLTNGSHTLTVTAKDISGKTTSSSVNFEKTAPYQPLNGEVFYMPFDGEILDLVTLTTGTSTNGVTFTSGVKGQAVSFDAAFKSYVLFQPNDAILGVESFTLSYWVNPDFVDSNNDNGIDGVLGLVNLSHSSRFWGNMDIFVENGSNPTNARMRLHFTTTNPDGTNNETWFDNPQVNNMTNLFGQWNSHIITYDATASQFKFYVNGALYSTVNASWSGPINFENSGPMVFGCVHFQTTPSLTTGTSSQPWASYLTGELDEVRLFNKAMSESEVLDLYNSEKP